MANNKRAISQQAASAAAASRTQSEFELIEVRDFFREAKASGIAGGTLTRIPTRAIVAVDLGNGAFRTYCFLLSYIPWSNSSSSSWPGRERIAESLGVSKRSVNRYITELREKGYVSLDKRKGKGPERYILYAPSLSHERASEDSSDIAASQNGPATESDMASKSGAETLSGIGKDSVSGYGERETGYKDTVIGETTKVQATRTLAFLDERLAKVGIDSETRSRVLMDYDLQVIQQALDALEQTDSLRNPAAYFLAAVEFPAIANAKGLLRRFIHSDSTEEGLQEFAGWACLMFERKDQALRLLELARQDEERLLANDKASYEQKEIAHEILSSFHEAIRSIEELPPVVDEQTLFAIYDYTDGPKGSIQHVEDTDQYYVEWL